MPKTASPSTLQPVPFAVDRATRPRAWPNVLFQMLLWLQGIYYALTGIWPLLSIESFQAVTGRKTDNLITGRESDHWLVMTVGVLVTAIAAALLAGAWGKQRPIELAILGLAAAIGLCSIDVLYVARTVLPPIYLADAAIEALIIVAWLVLITTQIG